MVSSPNLSPAEEGSGLRHAMVAHCRGHALDVGIWSLHITAKRPTTSLPSLHAGPPAVRRLRRHCEPRRITFFRKRVHFSALHYMSGENGGGAEPPRLANWDTEESNPAGAQPAPRHKTRSDVSAVAGENVLPPYWRRQGKAWARMSVELPTAGRHLEQPRWRRDPVLHFAYLC